MSVRKWAYEPWKCDGDICVGDCDLCSKAKWVRDDEEIEVDGFITPERELARPMERTSVNTAVPATECVYPRCEECDEYVRYKGKNYCSVPMVITKQMYHEALNKERVLEDRLCFVEELVLEATFNRDVRSQVRDEERKSDADALLSDGVD